MRTRETRPGIGAVFAFLVLVGTACGGTGPEPPRNLNYSQNPAIYTALVAISPNVPSSQGGAATSWEIAPALPDGMALDPSTGVIMGTPAAASPESTFVVTASNAAGAATVQLVLTVLPPAPVILSEPADLTVAVGRTATFQVTASSEGSLSYQWWRGGIAIEGATAGSYTTPPVAMADSGAIFLVTVTSEWGQVATSAPATLTVSSLFVATGALAIPRFGHTATLLADGRVLIVGGADWATGNTQLVSAELFDPDTGTFTATGSLGKGRQWHSAARLLDGRVLVAGGYTDDSRDSPTAEIYDPLTGTFSPTGSLVQGRRWHAATLLPSGNVLVFGGDGVRTAERYDPATGTFATAGSSLHGRWLPRATLLLDDTVLVTGSSTLGERYDPATEGFSDSGTTAYRDPHEATLLADGSVLISGDAFNSQYQLERYDPSQGTFTVLPLQVRRAYHTATLLTDGSVLFAGGLVGGSMWSPLGSAERYDPTTGALLDAGPLVTARGSHTATRLLDGRVLLAGGTEDGSVELYVGP